MRDEDLKQAGLKVTSPRRKILELLESAKDCHLSAEDIFQAFKENNEDIAIATIYRVLAQFEAAGMVIKHQFGEGHAVYELDQGEHHDHLICVDCHRVEEFVDPEIEKRQQWIAKKAGFEIAHHVLNIYGRCQRVDCPYRKTLSSNKK